MAINLVPNLPFNTKIKIIGIGGGGGNAVNTMISKNIEGVEFIVANTDMQDLEKSLAVNKIQLGKKTTKGLGAGANPNYGKDSALESLEEVEQLLEGTDMLFIAAGMGGGTGTGAAPVIAARAREKGILTLGIVTFPFKWEGKQRYQNAITGLVDLEENVDTLIVIPNDKVAELYGRMKVIDAFHKCDEILANAAQSVSDLINKSGYINVDFADVKTIMSHRGYALMGCGVASGEGRDLKAAQMASSNPLLSHVNLENCKGILINIATGHDFMMDELENITNSITGSTGAAENIITGITTDPDMTDTIRVTVIATGISYDTMNKLHNFSPVTSTVSKPTVTTVQPSPNSQSTQFTRSNPQPQSNLPQSDVTLERPSVRTINIGSTNPQTPLNNYTNTVNPTTPAPQPAPSIVTEYPN
ncbi:MAG: cell division protein FtsZ, partial [Candidatus Cloacimonetes bacterium]|nr:cell division protein FtsZ [Candidatus Cloacimonadota bacterium]